MFFVALKKLLKATKTNEQRDERANYKNLLNYREVRMKKNESAWRRVFLSFNLSFSHILCMIKVTSWVKQMLTPRSGEFQVNNSNPHRPQTR